MNKKKHKERIIPMKFIGYYIHKVDRKNRFILPKKIKSMIELERLPNRKNEAIRFIVIKKNGHYQLWLPKDFEQHLINTEKTIEDVCKSLDYIVTDKVGRLLMSYFGEFDKLEIIGMNDHIELRPFKEE